MCVSVCMPCIRSACRGQKRVLVNHLLRVLGSEPQQLLSYLSGHPRFLLLKEVTALSHFTWDFVVPCSWI